MFSGTKRATLRIIGGAAGAALVGTPSLAQSAGYDKVTSIGSRSEFDIPGGMFNLLEYPPASERLRIAKSAIGIRFQITESHLNPRWVSMVGFSVGNEEGSRALQVDFGDLPIYENLGMSAELVDYKAKQSKHLAQVLVPKFKRRDVQEIQLAVESNSVIAVVIDGKRRRLGIDFLPHRLIVRPSGVEGWVEFVEAQIA